VSTVDPVTRDLAGNRTVSRLVQDAALSAEIRRRKTMTETLSPGAAVEAFAEKVLGDYAGANAFFVASIGDRLGLFKDLVAKGPATSNELAARMGLQERYVREWLGGMAAAGYLEYDLSTRRYALPPHHAPVLAEEAGPSFLGCGFFDFSTNFGATYHQLVDAFRDGGGVPQEAYGEEVAESIERFTAPWFEHMLVQLWLPEMPDVLAKLEEGATLCDVGCGQGRAVIKLAQAFPRSRFVGHDVYDPAIRIAEAKAREAGVADRVRFEVRDVAEGLGDDYDVVTTFDVVHDSVDPRALLTAIRSALADNGRYICVDINCADRPEDNVGPLGTVLYGLSLAYCLPVSLAEGGAGLGTLGLPESKLTELATEAGFSTVRRLPIDDPFNNVYEISP
jgi:2-polyprenyl-3-methyl-5-hydroxy-6-metoxy-1,4-benzoquinol methylase